MSMTENGDGLRFGRKICRLTSVRAGMDVAVAAPEGRNGEEAARRIGAGLNALGYGVRILNNPEPEVMKRAGAPVIVIGNLSDSKCAKYLYYKFLSIVDRRYPGNGGYVVRTLADPFAAGHNVIHIGYSDAGGLRRAADRFLEKAADPLPYYNEVSYTNLPCCTKYGRKIMDSELPEDVALIPSLNASYWWYIGYLAYLTNDGRQIGKYLDGWRKVLEAARGNRGMIRSTHLHMYMFTIIEVWRLMEVSGMLPDELRGQIEECVFNWAQSSEGIGYATDKDNFNLILPSHNHTMFCALSLTYAADFFGKYDPELDEPGKWRQAADDVFYTFNHGGWKPCCDDSAYSNQTSLPLVCMYSIFEDEHRFLENGGRKVSEWIKSIMTQDGFIPSFGDGSVNNPFPGSLLRILSHYYRDGELRYLHDHVPDERNFLPEICLQGAFDSGVEPQALSGRASVRAVPLDRYLYDCWSKDSARAGKLFVTPPSGPYGECFDKLSLRTGWGDDDDFLLIDGLGTNIMHSYNDAMAVLDYTCHGVTWLVEEDSYRWPEPENCCILTIARNGFASEIPSYALLEENRNPGDGRFYLRLRLKNYNGTDWVREVFLIKGLCAVFRDTVQANEDGDYVVCSHFRTPGKASLEGNTLKSNRENAAGEKYELRLSGSGTADIFMFTDEIPVGKTIFTCGGTEGKGGAYSHATKMAELGKEMWLKRYHENSMVVTSAVTRASARLKKGESVSLAHVVHPAKQGEGDIVFTENGNRVCLEYAGETFEFSGVLPCARREKSQKGKGSGIPELPAEKTADFPDDITGIYPLDDRNFACSFRNGGLAVLRDGNILWNKNLGGEIHCAAPVLESGVLAVGFGTDSLIALDLQGNERWSTRIKGIPTIFGLWEMPHPQVVAVKCKYEDGVPYIVAGCGDDHIRIFDLSGRLVRAFYIYATVPDIIEFAEMDADGKEEMLIAGREASSQGVFYVHDFSGKEGRHLYTGPWLNTIRSYEIRRGSGGNRIVCGMKCGDNFKVFETAAKGEQKTLAALKLGGTVNAVCFGPGNAYYAGTSMGFLVSLGESGGQRWYLDLGAPVKALFRCRDGVIAACADGRIYRAADFGRIAAGFRLPWPFECCVKTGGGILAGCGGELYRLPFEPEGSV